MAILAINSPINYIIIMATKTSGKMSPWGIIFFAVGIMLIFLGLVAMATIFMFGIGVFFIALGLMLCIGGLKSAVTPASEIGAEPGDEPDEPERD